MFWFATPEKTAAPEAAAPVAPARSRTCHELGVCLHSTTACTGLCQQALARGVESAHMLRALGVQREQAPRMWQLAPGMLDGPHRAARRPWLQHLGRLALWSAYGVIGLGTAAGLGVFCVALWRSI